jgi:hypothetical protein
MMGQQPRTESLFYYFRLEEQIPADHFHASPQRFSDMRPACYNRVKAA